MTRASRPYWPHSNPSPPEQHGTAVCAAGCTLPGRHDDDACSGVDCPGCQGAPAHTGPCCRRCERTLTAALEQAPGVYDDLAEELRRSGGAVEGHGTPSPPCIDPAVADARAQLLAVTCSWCRVLCEERNLTPPDPAIGLVCVRLLVHADWLVAQPWADEAIDEIVTAFRTARWLVQPSGRRRFPVAPCTVTGCAGTLIALVADTDSLLPSELVCNADDDHRWSSDRWVRLGRTIHVEDVVDAR